MVAALSEQEPPREILAKYGWVRTKDSLIGRVFTFECVPSGLYTRLLVRCFQLCRVLCFWRTGSLLRYDRQGGAAIATTPTPPGPGVASTGSGQLGAPPPAATHTMALIEASLQQLRLYIRGPDAGFLLAALVSAINNLLAHHYPELRPEIKCVCTCTTCSNSARIWLYTEKECEVRKKEKT